MSARLVLFDIDGTLLSASGISSRALGEALVAVFGATGPMESYDYSGKTDPQIVRELMRDAGFEDREIDRRMAWTLDVYAAWLGEALRPEHVRPKPGIEALVRSLAANPRVTLGLLTGNLEVCARLKLDPLRLNERFPFGAYGSDHEDRKALPPVAVARALERTGRRFEGKSVVIVGDSIHDVRCGRGLGVRAVAVTTGKTSAAELHAEGPDAVLADFSQTEAALDAILG